MYYIFLIPHLTVLACKMHNISPAQLSSFTLQCILLEWPTEAGKVYSTFPDHLAYLAV